MLPENLLIDIKNYIDMTWEDAESDKKLSGIIARGMHYMDDISGSPMDYTKEDKPRELLFNYVRYDMAGALDIFQKNYLHELLLLQIGEKVKNDASTEQEGQE